jgi:hypothetical protein
MDLETVPPAEELRSRLRPDDIRRLQRRKGDVTCQPDGHEDLGSPASLTEETFRSLSLYAEYGRVLAIGVIIEADDRPERRGVLGRKKQSEMFHLDEGHTLRDFWRLLKDFDTRRDLVVGHNIMDFDLPFIIKRSRVHRVRPSVAFSFARYRSAPIYDTMREWAHWNPRAPHISLAHLAEVLNIGIAKTAGMDGSCVYDEFLAGNQELIARYCLQDVDVVRAVYYRMVFAEAPEPRKESAS